MNKAKEELLSLKYDDDFKEIKDLKWLPWIGAKYFDSEPCLLIVGESHYLLPKTDKHYEKNKQEAKQLDFTRNVVQTKCIDDKKKPQPFYDNLNRCLFGKKKMENITLQMREEKWQQLAFYNFVQRPMKNNKKRPKSEDWETGWKVFAELIKILKPTKCIFIGVAAADNNNKYECIKKEKVGRVAPRFFEIPIGEQNAIPCIAIKHTSQYFSWEEWYKFLKINDFLI